MLSGPALAGPNFALKPSPSTLEVTQANPGTATITVSAVNGFKGTVALNVTAPGQPAGLTASLSPTSVTGAGASTLTVSTTDSLPSPNLPIVVTGNSGGLTQWGRGFPRDMVFFLMVGL